MRWYTLMGILVLGMVVITGRLFWLTVINGDEALARAEGNRIEWVELPAPRGIIYDRQGEALVRNIPGEKPNQVKREYVYGVAMAHILGYVGESDGFGKMGVEQWLDNQLRGQDGAEIVETGADGSLRRLGRREPVVGEEVRLTIDAGLQRKVTEVLADRKGGVVATTPQTGEILALASSPGFDPNLFSGQLSVNSNQEKQIILTSPDKPLFNRVTDGVYAPGSIFKLVTAVAGLETGKIDAATRIEDTGEIRVGEFRYGNWYFDQYGKLEGSVDIVRALGRSNDIFFYRVGEMVGAQGVADWARRLGLGESLSLGWAADSAGLVPDPAWKEKFKGERWFLGNTYHLAIGQGDVGVTVLQINLMTGAIGNGGKLCSPVISNQLSVISCQELGISQKTLELVRQGMKAACSPKGTAFPLFDFEPVVACKTGTAQHGGKLSLPHAWITILAPGDPPAGGPEVALTVLLEAAGEGSYEAAPVAKEILEYWFKERQGMTLRPG